VLCPRLSFGDVEVVLLGAVVGVTNGFGGGNFIIVWFSVVGVVVGTILWWVCMCVNTGVGGGERSDGGGRIRSNAVS
jgi:hypothetical protein